MIYNLLLLLGTFYAIPKWLFQKKYRGTFLERIGWHLPAASSKPFSIWIHMVSMGETKAMTTIYEALRKKYPDAAFHLSTATATGKAEAKRSLKGADSYFFLPLDLPWVMKRLVKRLSPNLLILSESDFWYNQIKTVKQNGGKVILLNGKISERSAVRFMKFPRFSKKLFDSMDHLCIQSYEYAERFASLKISAEKNSITGNLKLAIPTPKLSPEDRTHLQNQFGIKPDDVVITLGSTHEGEERSLLEQLQGVNAKILVVPRHPERFPVVKKYISELQNPNILLVDQMGILSKCYQLSSIAIVGGSFVPGIGGHNIFEPIQADIPVIFGPYMHTQKQLVDLVLGANAGIQTPIEGIPEAIEKISSLTDNAKKLAAEGERVHENTWEKLKAYLP